MKVVVFSDTHGMHNKIKIPDGDVLIFCGDFSKNGNERDLISFNMFLGKQPHKNKIVIAGNHDFCLEDNISAFAFLTNAIYLKDEEIVIDGIKFYGSPYTPNFGHWAFMLDKKKLKRKWNNIPNDVDVLITHGPPYGKLDITMSGSLAGCKELDKRVKNLKPKYHVFGHIHEGYGEMKDKNTNYINASICDFHYKSINKPIVFEI